MSEYSDSLKINDKYRQYVRNTFHSTYNVLEGAVRSSKTVFNILAFCLNLENTTDKLHLACAVDVSTAKAVLGECNGFGIHYYFGNLSRYCLYKDKPSLEIHTQNGTKYVIFSGGGKSNSFASIRGLSFGSVIATEVNLFDESYVQEFIRRTVAADDRKFYWDLNPSIPTDWIYTDYLDRFQNDPTITKYNYMHATLVDNPSLSKDRIDEIVREYDPSSVEYRFAILGERVNPEGSIYDIRDYNIIDNFEPNNYMEYIIVCDQGESISASVFILAGLRYDIQTREYAIDILKNYYWKNSTQHGLGVKMFSDTADDLCNFIKSSANVFGRYPSKVLIDEDPEFYRNCKISFNNNSVPTSLLRYVIKDDIEERIKMGINLLYKGKLRFMSTCKEVVEDFKNAVYDTEKIEKTGKFERLKVYTSTGHLDSVDATEYAISWYKNKLYIK